MSLHIEAKSGEIASTVLIAGDPLRAKFFSEHFLQGPQCYNRIRGMLGFTGTYRGKRISIQGTGIGIPSTALYIHELVMSYRVNRIIRIGTCGALQQGIQIGDLICGTEAISDSVAVEQYLGQGESLTSPSASLLRKVTHVANEMKVELRKGLVFSTDLFYSEDTLRHNKLTKRGVLGVDMETAMLYAMGSFHQFESLSLLTVSDNILTGEMSSTEYRERKTIEMVELALETERRH